MSQDLDTVRGKIYEIFITKPEVLSEIKILFLCLRDFPALQDYSVSVIYCIDLNLIHQYIISIPENWSSHTEDFSELRGI